MNIYCDEIHGPEKPDCCNSCHDEFDEGYSDHLNVQLPDGRWTSVCCTVATWLRTNPDITVEEI